MWRVEPLLPSHADASAGLYRQFFPQNWERAWSGAEFAALLATPGCFGHLLIDGEYGILSGLIVLRAAADEAEIITLGVIATRRRSGGAALLLDRALTECTARAVRTVFLDVAEDNEPARRLYEAQGFTIVGTRAAYYSRGAAPSIAALTMRRSLTRDA
jgi:ribosomal-protein-alanine N-acetyltransferase